MFVNSDFSELLSLFNNNNVKNMVIGGYAFIQYPEPRFTKDLDLWISTDSSNASAVFAALHEFGAPLVDLTEEDFAEEGYFYQMGIPGIEFETAWANRLESDFDGLIVPFISKDDLIAAKRAAGRPQDLIDVDVLESK